MFMYVEDNFSSHRLTAMTSQSGNTEWFLLFFKKM